MRGLFYLCPAQLAGAASPGLICGASAGFGMALSRLSGVRVLAGKLLVSAILNGAALATFLSVLLKLWFQETHYTLCIAAGGILCLAWNRHLVASRAPAPRRTH